MSTDHNGGNIQNTVTLEEHDGVNNAKRVNVVAGGVGQATVNVAGAATIFAVVNTGASSDPGTFIGLTTAVIGNPTLYAVVNTGAAEDPGTYIGLNTSTLGVGDRFIGLTTVVQSSSVRSLAGNVTLSDAKTYIGLTTATIGNTVTVGAHGITGNVTLSDAKTYVGLTTTTLGLGTKYVGLATVDMGVNQAWTDPKTYIGLVTITGSLAAAAGNVTLDDGSLVGLVAGVANIGFASVTPVSAWPNPNTFIGLVTVAPHALTASTINIGSVSVLGGGIGLNAGVNSIGFASVTPVQAWPDPHTYIGLVTITGSLAAAAGNVTLDDGSLTGLVAGVANIGFATVFNATAWPDPKTYLGLVTVGHTVTVALDQTGTNNDIQVLGNVTLSDAKTYIGLVTATLGTSTISSFGRFVNLGSLLSIADLGFGPMIVDNFGRQILGDSKGYIGLVTVTQASSARTITGNVTLSDAKTNIGLVTLTGGTAWTDPKTYIGLVTITGSLAAASGNVTLDDGSLVGLIAGVANVGFATVFNATAWPNPNTFIGLVTTAPHALTASTVNIGSVSVLGGGIGLNAGVNSIGFATVNQVNQPALVASNVYVGLVTNTPAAVDTKVYIGLVTSTNGIGNTFIGLVTAWTRNAGSAKTMVGAPISFISAGSLATIAKPTNANTIYVTNILLSSDATVRISVKAGATYLTGNASFGITLFPGGGFVQSGSPDSPVYIGLPSGALIIEKLDLTATSAKIGGNLIYFEE